MAKGAVPAAPAVFGAVLLCGSVLPPTVEHEAWSGEEATAWRKGTRESQSRCQGQSQLLWSGSLLLHGCAHQRDLAWPYPWVPWSLRLARTHPQHTLWSPSHGSSEPAGSHPVSRAPRLRPRRKSLSLRKNSVTTGPIGQEARDSQKCDCCGPRVCGSVSRGLWGLPSSLSRVWFEGGKGTLRPEELRMLFLPCHPRHCHHHLRPGQATPVKSSNTGSSGTMAAVMCVREPGGSVAISHCPRHSRIASLLCGLGQMSSPLCVLTEH